MPRTCFREPIREIAKAAALLDGAVTAHLLGHALEAEALIRQADIPAVAEWTESILGKNSHYVLVRPVLETSIPKDDRIPMRMPNASDKMKLHERDGYHCRFCGIPVIRQEIRKKIQRAYPGALRWGKRNAERHAAFFAMWAQYDHLIPHSKGGTNELENLIVACAACNYGRGGYTLGEVNLSHPLERQVVKSPWDGLARFARPANFLHKRAG